MKGKGHYNENSLPQSKSIELGTQKVVQFLTLIAQRLGKDFSVPKAEKDDEPRKSYATFVDYGCSQGANSVKFFSKFIAEFVRKESPSLPILLVHEDQATNDWDTLLNTSTKSRYYSNFSKVCLV